MQIQASFQPPEPVPALERIKEKEKVEIPEAKVRNDLESTLSAENSKKLDEVKSVFEENNISISFSKDDETKALVVKLVDKITGEEIRQIPTEVSLKLVAINAKMQGNFVDETS